MSESLVKGSKLPFFNFSKESFKLVIDMLEGDDMSIFMTALYAYIYEGVEPNFNNKVMNSVWNNVLSVIERKGESYFNRKKHIEGVNKKRKENSIQPNAEFDNEPQISENKGIITSEYPNPQPKEESVSEGQKMGKNRVLPFGLELDPIVDDEIDEDDCRNEENIKEIIFNSIKRTNAMENVTQEYINDIVDMIKDVTKEGDVDWSKVGPWVSKLAEKHNKHKSTIDKLFKEVIGLNKAA